MFRVVPTNFDTKHLAQIRAIASNSRGQLKQEGIIQTSPETFLLEAHFRRILLENIQSEMAKDCHVLRTITGTNARIILTERHI